MDVTHKVKDNHATDPKTRSNKERSRWGISLSQGSRIDIMGGCGSRGGRLSGEGVVTETGGITLGMMEGESNGKDNWNRGHL